MGTLKKPPHMKNNGGVLSYRRCVPLPLQKTLGFSMWNRPCGDVTDAEAAAKVLAWTKQDDELIRQLSDPDFKASVRRDTEAHFMTPKAQAIIDAQNSGGMPEAFDPIQAAQAGIKAADLVADPEDRLIRYRAILAASFGDHIKPPTDLDERGLYDMVKRHALFKNQQQDQRRETTERSPSD